MTTARNGTYHITCSVKTTMSRSIITNFLLFQLGWFACVLGGAHDQVLLGCIIAMSVIAYHFYQTHRVMPELRLLMISLIIGITFESIVTSSGIARYSHGQPFEVIAPLWMILMWPLFATTLNLSMRWLKNLSPVFIGLLGGLMAPMAYYAGNRLGAVEYDEPALSLGIIAIAWATILPGLVAFSLKHNGFSKAVINLDDSEAPQNV
jgi:hypothetical protein